MLLMKEYVLCFLCNLNLTLKKMCNSQAASLDIMQIFKYILFRFYRILSILIECPSTIAS